MSKEYQKRTNKVRIIGKLEGEFEYYYTLSKENIYQEYYINYLVIEGGCKRKHIPVVMEKSRVDFEHEYKDEQVEIIGRLKETKYKKKVFMYVQIKTMVPTQEEYSNQVMIECVVHKKLISRVDDDGNLRLDFKIAYYDMIISCVAWGRNARYIKDKVGVKTKVFIYGNIATRQYCKDDKWTEVNELCVSDIRVM